MREDEQGAAIAQQLQRPLRHLDDAELAAVRAVDEDLAVGEIHPPGIIGGHAFTAALGKNLEILERAAAPESHGVRLALRGIAHIKTCARLGYEKFIRVEGM